MFWILRLSGQSGGRGWLPTLYAIALYGPLTAAALTIAKSQFLIGFAQLRLTGGFFTAAFKSSFFGLTQILTWVPMTCTFLVGRWRYAALLAEVRRSVSQDSRLPSFPDIYRNMGRHATRLLITIIAVVILVMTNHLLQMDVGSRCTAGDNCARVVMMSMIFSLLDLCMLFIPIKLSVACTMIGGGFSVVHAELKTMIDKGFISKTKLVQLRRRQCELSSLHSRLTSGMSMELILCMLYGIIAQISSFLLAISIIQNSHQFANIPGITLSTYRAIFTMLMPCEAAQSVLDIVDRTRDTLLQMHSDDLGTSQELLLLLEATRRDLDGLGDLSLYRLRRSTVLAITSAVITYIIVFLQFQMPEDPTGVGMDGATASNLTTLIG